MNWSGSVYDVGEASFLSGWPIIIEIRSDCAVGFHFKDQNDALKYSRGQNVIISGEIEFVEGVDEIYTDYILIHLRDETVVIR